MLVRQIQRFKKILFFHVESFCNHADRGGDQLLFGFGKPMILFSHDVEIFGAIYTAYKSMRQTFVYNFINFLFFLRNVPVYDSTPR